MHLNINLIERTNKMQPCNRILNCSTCFGRNTAHHQKLKNCNCSLWFYIRKPATINYVKPEAAITVFELLMMGGVSPETCWAIKKHLNKKFYYAVASCWFFLWDFYYTVPLYRILEFFGVHERPNIPVSSEFYFTYLSSKNTPRGFNPA